MEENLNRIQPHGATHSNFYPSPHITMGTSNWTFIVIINIKEHFILVSFINGATLIPILGIGSGISAYTLYLSVHTLSPDMIKLINTVSRNLRIADVDLWEGGIQNLDSPSVNWPINLILLPHPSHAQLPILILGNLFSNTNRHRVLFGFSGFYYCHTRACGKNLWVGTIS